MMILLALLAQVTMSTTAVQTIDGFGAAGSIFGNNGWANEGQLTDAHLQLLFSPSQGIGLSILRLGIASVDAGTGSKFEDNNPGFQNMLLDAKRALKLNPALKVVLTPWSPNTACKSGGSLLSGSFLTACNSSWSTYIGQAVDDAQNAGVPIYAVSPQNEPDFDPGGTHEGCTFTAAAWAAWVDVLKPVLAAKSPAPKLMGPEPSSWANLESGTNYMGACVTDVTCLANVDVWSVHQYGPPVGTVTTPVNLRGKRLWMEEVSNADGTPVDGINSGLAWATFIHNAIVTGQASGWVAWYAVTSSGTNDDGLIDSIAEGSVVTKRFWAEGNYSKFVKPGMVVFTMTGTPPTNVLVSAYKDPTSNNTVFVAINSQAGTSALTVNLQAASNVRMMTPWLTDSTHDLVSQTPIAVSARVITYTLPGNSIVTFVGNGT